MEKAFIEEKIRQLEQNKAKVEDFLQFSSQKKKKGKKAKILQESQKKAKKQLERIEKNIAILEKAMKKTK